VRAIPATETRSWGLLFRTNQLSQVGFHCVCQPVSSRWSQQGTCPGIRRLTPATVIRLEQRWIPSKSTGRDAHIQHAVLEHHATASTAAWRLDVRAHVQGGVVAAVIFWLRCHPLYQSWINAHGLEIIR